MRAAAAGVLGHQMTAGLEQAAAFVRKQRGAADRQLGAELLSGEPGVRRVMAAGAAGVGQRGRLPRGRPIPVRSMEGLWGKQALPMTCSAGYRWLSGP
jgi:hypothetical protein